ncbi:MAG: hypothetical protein OEV06_10610 [Anaerolineae bacterium]|nr:hypothetical protein [Anaerolineae bacterium]
MTTKKTLVLFGIVSIAVLVLAACGAQGDAGPQGEPGPQGDTGPAGPAGEAPMASDMTCTECHNDTTLIAGKTTAWEESMHGSGDAYGRGSRSSCAGCHSGGGFSDMVAAGINPGEVENGDPNPTRQDCRTCHQIHTSYSGDDWALKTTAAVEFYAVEGVTYDGGEGNLCATCHQPRRVFPEAVDGQIEITSTHWGPHHGGQGSVLMGVAGAGPVEGKPSKHATEVEDTCVACHLGPDDGHSFEPVLSVCTECHEEAESFDIDGLQTEIQALLDELEEILIARGLLDEEGHPNVQFVDELEGAALWNWIYLAHEDGSYGVHNPSYTKALLEWSIAVFE